MSPAVLLGPLALVPQASDVTIRLVDVAEQAGLTLLNICGGSSKDYILDVNGNGAALFDYDNDGDMDALIVNGSTWRRSSRAAIRWRALPQRREGTLRRHRGKRTSRTGWGMGTCVADYDNDGFQDIYLTAFGPGRARAQQRRRNVHGRHDAGGGRRSAVEHQLRLR